LQSPKLLVIPGEASGTRRGESLRYPIRNLQGYAAESLDPAAAGLGMTGAIERAILQRDRCGSAQIATNRLRRARGSLDPHSIRD
jgi:hypothetical protein